MTVQERIRKSMLLEKMRKNKETAERLGLKDESIFRNQKKNIERNHSLK